MKNTNYFFSGCIENLGVVPLFSLACFLFAPAFFLFKFLLHLVCIVFEAIIISLNSYINLNNRTIYLSFLVCTVKTFSIIAYGGTINQDRHIAKDIFLSKGEQFEIKMPKLQKYSVGNNEVLKYKYLPRKSLILLKGKSIGFSDLVIWNSNKTKQIYNFYVTSKRKQLNIMDVAASLKNTSLKYSVNGGFLHISGEIRNNYEYTILKKIESKKADHIIFETKIEFNFRNEIFGSVYKNLYSQGIENVKCNNFGIQIHCLYEEGKNGKPNLKFLKNKYFINFQSNKFIKKSKNFNIDFKIVLLTNSNVANTTFGINKIEANLEELFRNRTSNLKTNQIILENQNGKLELIACPTISLTLNSPFNVQLGGEIPFEFNQNNQAGIDWKFAGLKIKGELELKFNSYYLKYSSALTSPQERQISGPKGKSTSFLKLNVPFELFKIDLKNNSEMNSAIPGLGKIPFLKALFSKNINSNSNRKIIAYATLRESP